jgi:pyruvate formate lyase activating enzyme
VIACPPTGLVFDVQRFSLHDGPGIRTTVFLKGCPLACRWCHNPEGATGAPEILVTPNRCIECGACVEACPRGLPSGVAGGWAAPRSLCEACGRCAEECPTGARRLVGQEMTVARLVEEVTRDRAFYDQSGGGVTFSGGEPLRQPEFVLACLEALSALGVHTAIDTCGHVERADLLQAAELADLFLYDLKHLDPVAHAEWTGVSNERILANIEALALAHGDIWVRLAVIPGVNDDTANLRRTASFAASLRAVRRVSLLPYHELGADKRERFGMPGGGEPFRSASPSPARMLEIAAIFEEAGLPTAIGA